MQNRQATLGGERFLFLQAEGAEEKGISSRKKAGPFPTQSPAGKVMARIDCWCSVLPITCILLVRKCLLMSPKPAIAVFGCGSYLLRVFQTNWGKSALGFGGQTCSCGQSSKSWGRRTRMVGVSMVRALVLDKPAEAGEQKGEPKQGSDGGERGA